MISRFIDSIMYQLYSATVSLMDLFVATAISILGGWWYLALLPWFMYSSWQKVKYEKYERSEA